MSPICQRCSGYYVREPCPYCNPPERQVELEARKESLSIPEIKVGTIDQLQLRQSNLKQEIQKLRDENEKTVAELKEKEKTFLSEIGNFKKEFDSLKATLSTEESITTEKVTQLDAKEKELVELESKIGILEEEKGVVDDSLTNLKSEIASLEQEKAALNGEINGIISEIGAKEEELNKI